MLQGISRLAFLAALGGLTTLAPVQGVSAQEVEEEAQDLGTIVLTAMRTATERLRSGVSVSVVTEEDIAKDRSNSVAEYLTKLPGVSLTHYGPFGNSAELRVRGMAGGYLAVLQDGIRVNDAANPKNIFDFGSSLTADVGRIEVLRGSQSALWGNSAVGGVINISSLGATEEGFHQKLNLEGGSYGTARLSYGVSYKDDRAEVAATLTRYHTDGYSAARAGTEADGGDATRLSLAGRYKISDSLTLGGAAFYQKTEQEYDDWREDAANLQWRREKGARVFAEISSGATEHVVEASIYDVRRDFTQTDGANGYQSRRLALGWQATTEASTDLSFVYGLDWSEDEARYRGGYGTLPEDKKSTRIAGVFGQVLWSPVEGLDIATTLRVDDDSHFGRFSTGRLALAWQASEALTLSASVANGYRAPTIDERYAVYPDWIEGNPDLDPETSLSYELGAEYVFEDGGNVSATLFRIELDDRIEADYSALPLTYHNAKGASVLQGVEIGSTLALSEAWTLDTAYTYTDGQGATGTRLTGVPYHTLALTLEGDVTEQLSTSVTLKAMSGWQDVFSRKSMPTFAVVNAQVNYDLTDAAQVYLRVENLLDRDFEVSDGYGTTGRAAYLGLQAKF